MNTCDLQHAYSARQLAPLFVVVGSTGAHAKKFSMGKSQDKPKECTADLGD